MRSAELPFRLIATRQRVSSSAMPGADARIPRSVADGRVWVLDAPGEGKLRLLRIDATTGAVETNADVPPLQGFERIWLAALEDGRIVVVGTHQNQHRVAVIANEPFAVPPRLRVDGSWLGSGRVVLPPVVRFGGISLAVEKTVKGKPVGVEPTLVRPTAPSMSWSALSHALQ
jgi:hypothetical protein